MRSAQEKPGNTLDQTSFASDYNPILQMLYTNAGKHYEGFLQSIFIVVLFCVVNFVSCAK
jgi:hypothetical protein